MKLLISAAIALGLVFGAALALPGPTAQAANCEQVKSFNGKFFNFVAPYTLGAGVQTKLGAPAEVWTFERSDDSGATYAVVQSSLTKSWAGSSTIPTTATTRVRISASGCSFVYDPNETLPWEMRLFYGPF